MYALPSNGIKYDNNDNSKQSVQQQKHQEKIWYREMVKRIQRKVQGPPKVQGRQEDTTENVTSNITLPFNQYLVWNNVNELLDSDNVWQIAKQTTGPLKKKLQINTNNWSHRRTKFH